MKQLLLIGCWIGCLNACYGQDSLFTLPRIWEQALLYNKELKAKQLDLQKSEALVKETRDLRLPEIQVDGRYARVTDMPVYENGVLNKPAVVPVNHQSYSVGGEASVNLYNGGKTRLGIDIRKTEQASAVQAQAQTQGEVKFRCAYYFFELVRYHQFIQLTTQEIAQEEKQLKDINSLFRNGTVLKSDVLRAELKVSQQQLLLKEIGNNILLAEQQLNILMGRPDNAPLQPDFQYAQQVMPEVPDYESWLGTALQSAFAYKISENDITLSALHLKEIKSAILPKVSLFAGYSYSYPQFTFYPYANALYGLGQAGVKVSLPISNLYLNKNKTQVAVMAYRQQRIYHDMKQDDIRNEVRAAYLHYTEALEKITIAKKNIARTTESCRILKHSYFNQQSLLTDMLDAETQLLQSSFDLTSAQMNAQVQFYQLLKVVGKI